MNESKDAIIEGLEADKKHLELCLNENMALKEQYITRCDNIQ